MADYCHPGHPGQAKRDPGSMCPETVLIEMMAGCRAKPSMTHIVPSVTIEQGLA